MAGRLGQSLCVWDVLLSKQEAVEDTPSRKDGMSKGVEKAHRRNYVELISKVCKIFKTNPDVPMIATVYCHRFFAARSMVRNDCFMVATSAIFLTLKVADICRPIRDVLTVAYALHNGLDQQKVAAMFRERDDMYRPLKRKVVQAERALLYVVGFNFKPELPSKYFLSITKQDKFPHLSAEEITTLQQICLNFNNDSLKTTLWLQYTAKELAYAFIYITAKFAKIKLSGPPTPGTSEWFEADGMTVQRMQEVTNELLDHYEGKKASKPKKEKKKQCEKSSSGVSADKNCGDQAMQVPVTPDLPAVPPSPNEHAQQLRQYESHARAPGEVNA